MQGYQNRCEREDSYGMHRSYGDHEPQQSYGYGYQSTQGRLGSTSQRSHGSSEGHNSVSMLLGLVIGAALMYIFDPVQGPRRRALLRDQAVGLSYDVAGGLQGQARHLRNRGHGLVEETRSVLTHGRRHSEESDVNL